MHPDIMNQRFCGKCGTPLTPSVKFCTSCGAPVLSATEAAAPVTPDGPHPASSRLLIAVTVLVVVAAACVALVLLLPPPAVLVTPSANLSGDPGGSGPIIPAGTQTDGLTTASVTGIPGFLQTTATATPSPAAVPTAGTVPVTIPVSTVATTAALTTTPTVIPTEVPTTRPTSQITLAVTHVPVQPPSGSSTSFTPGAPALDPSVIEARIHEMINTQREKNGLAPLSYDLFLADIARGHSWDMVTRQFFDHINPDGKNARARGDDAGYPCIRYYKSYSTQGIAENLFQGNRYRSYYTTTNDPNGTVSAYDWNSAEQIADTAVAGWMNSSGHRENILTSSYYMEGIGVAFAPDDKIYVTENFC